MTVLQAVGRCFRQGLQRCLTHSSGWEGELCWFLIILQDSPSSLILSLPLSARGGAAQEPQLFNPFSPPQCPVVEQLRSPSPAPPKAGDAVRQP